MSALRRHHDWQLRLEAFTRARREIPFAWGANDCACFAADAVEALTGERLLPDMRGLAVRDALRFMRERDGLRGIASRVLGEAVSPKLAAVGDVVLILEGKREALGVCNGTSVLAAGPQGMAVVSMTRAIACWKV
jgi:hypothetical protein